MTDKNKVMEEAKRVLTEEKEALGRISESSINDSFLNAAEAIAGANKLIVTGVGKSGMIARKIAATFSSIGKSAVFMHPVDALHGDLGIVQESDAAILLSKSGSTEDIVRLIPYLKMRKAKIIAIVGNERSFLARSADHVINASVEKEACPFNLAPTTSTTVALALGDALAVSVMSINNVTVEDFSRLHPLGQIGRNITVQVKDIMHAGEDLPVVSINAYFRQAVIEMTDKALGCVCITNSGDKLEGVITDGDVRRALQKFDDIRDLTVKDIMTADPTTVHEDAYLSEALALMENRSSQISILPVLNDKKKLAGVVRVHDIVRSGL